MNTGFRLNSNLSVEMLQGEVIVFLHESQKALRLEGEAAELVRSLRSGKPSGEASPAVLTRLLREEILLEEKFPSRRSIIGAGVGTGLAGIAVLALPSVSMAASNACPVIQSVPDSTDNNYGGAGIWFEIIVSSVNSITPPGYTRFRVGANFLPVGTYYYRVSGPSSGTVEAFTVEDSFTVANDGEYIQLQFDRIGVVENGSPSNYTPLLEYDLFSNESRTCPISFTTDFDEAAGV